MVYIVDLFGTKIRWPSPLSWLVLGLALVAGGCASPTDSTQPYAALKLSDIRQASNGQIALIYNQQKPQPPGQRLYIVDQNVLGHNVSTALVEIKSHPGYGETFASSVVVHRTYVHNNQGDEVFWVELDPLTLPGTWIPSLTLPPLPTGATEQALPATFHGSTFPVPISAVNSATPSPAMAQFSWAAPNQHFIWMTADGPLETSVSSRTLFPPPYGDTWGGRAEKVIGGTVAIVGGLAYITGVVALDILIDSRIHCR